MDPMIILLAGGGFAFVLLVIGIVVSISSERSLVEERLGRYIEEEQMTIGDGSSGNTAPLTDWINQRVQRSSFGENISRELARADIKLKPGEYIALMIIASVGIGVVAWFIGGQSILLGAIGAIFGLFVPRFYVRHEQGQRLVRFQRPVSRYA